MEQVDIATLERKFRTVGVLFAIEPESAYAAFFRGVDTRKLAGSLLYSGYPFAGHPRYQERARHYCIAVRTAKRAVDAYITRSFRDSAADGLLPFEERFAVGIRLPEHLVFTATINATGELGCQPGAEWIRTIWQQARSGQSM